MSLYAIQKWNQILLQDSTNLQNLQIIDSYVARKYFLCFKEYFRRGDDTKVIYIALEKWFCIKYLAFILAVFIRVLHIVKYRGYNRSDTDNMVFLIGFDLMAFLVPYVSGIFFNYCHSQFYKKMVKDLLSVRVNETIISYENFTKEQEGMYGIFFASMKSKETRKEDNNDFVPSLLSVCIPLDNPVYIFSLLLTITTGIFNFIDF